MWLRPAACGVLDTVSGAPGCPSPRPRPRGGERLEAAAGVPPRLPRAAARRAAPPPTADEERGRGGARRTTCVTHAVLLLWACCWPVVGRTAAAGQADVPLPPLAPPALPACRRFSPIGRARPSSFSGPTKPDRHRGGRALFLGPAPAAGPRTPPLPRARDPASPPAGRDANLGTGGKPQTRKPWTRKPRTGKPWTRKP